jgi:hypothetical protein
MTDAVAPAAADVSPKPAKRPAFTFTDAGCRTEVRAGVLLVLAAVFLWLWAGPTLASKIYLAGATLLVIGLPIQAVQSRRGRPGFPWKVGVAMTLLGLAMWPDLIYREAVGGPRRVQDIAWMLTAAGAWVLLWWPVAALGRRRAEAA